MSGQMATIQQLRESSGRSRALVASHLNMSERHLYRLERGKSPIRRVLALAFANYYGVDVADIDGVDSHAGAGEAA